MITAAGIDEIRAARRKAGDGSCGFVPTMGALHAGHLSLIEKARAENDIVAASIFVNPTQFNDKQDLAAYPRNLEADAELLRKAGVDVLWTPTPELVYPAGFQTWIDVENMSEVLEGAARPGHFRGVATVVAKLFNVIQPHRAYLGQKDAQQVLVIQRMTRDLNFDIDIIVCPTIREADGLAMSSRNARLSPEGRAQAVCLFEALRLASQLFEDGERRRAVVFDKMQTVISQRSLARIDYISFANTDTLEELEQLREGVLVSLAVRIEDVRLIDNLMLGGA